MYWLTCYVTRRLKDRPAYSVTDNYLATMITESPVNLDLQPINDQCSPTFRNQSIDLQCKSIDWFLYDREHVPLMG